MATEEPPATTPPGNPRPPRRFRVPTTLVVTILGGALTILILPAFTRQWDERQRALDLKTGLVSQISIATGQSITAAETRFETYDGKAANFEEQTSAVAPGLPLRRRWLADKLKIEGTLRAYFSPEVFAQWRAFDKAMVTFLYIAGLEGRINADSRVTNGKSVDGPPLNGYDLFNIDRYLRGFRDADRIRGALLSRRVTDRRLGFLGLEDLLLDMEANFTSRLLSAEPRGFSTTRMDLIDDLLP